MNNLFRIIEGDISMYNKLYHVKKITTLQRLLQFL
jgi:hypothetical protein